MPCRCRRGTFDALRCPRFEKRALIADDLADRRGASDPLNRSVRERNGCSAQTQLPNVLCFEQLEVAVCHAGFRRGARDVPTGTLECAPHVRGFECGK